MRTSILTAALAGTMSVGILWAQQSPTPAQLPPGTAPKQLNDQEDVRSILGSTVNAAVTKGAFDDLSERFSTADRKRLGDFVKRDFPALDAKVDQLRTAWKAKYGQDIKMDDKQQLNAMLLVLEGEVTDPALAKLHWPLRVTNTRSNEPIQASDSSSSAEYLDKGRNVAIVTIPSTSNAMPTLYLSMLHENVDSWRIDIPDSISGEQIYNNLLANLTRFAEKIDSWPANVNEASRQLTYTVFSAVYNVPPREAGQASAR